MTRSYAEAPATHFRLKPETWDIIAEEYKDGATAKDLGAKWKVSPTSIYRYACRDGWTKKTMGDARARAHARMVEDEEAAVRSLSPVGSRALKSLFAPARASDPDAGDPTALAREALLASGRAMKGRLWAEAKTLAGLAESYGRMAERMGAGIVDPMKLPLKTVLAVVEDQDGVMGKRLNFDPRAPYDEETEMKKQAVRRKIAATREMGYPEWALEALVRDMLGVGPRPIPMTDPAGDGSVF